MGTPDKNERVRHVRRAKAIREQSAGKSYPERLALLYDIGKKLTRASDPERLIPDVLSTAAEALALRSAVLALRVDRTTRLIAWPADGADVAAAMEHARAMFSYLLQEPELAAHGVEVRRGALARTARPPSGGEAPGAPRQFIVLPLAAQDHPAFGAIQLESSTPLTEVDLSLVASIVTQLAVALDRHLTTERRYTESERRRVEAEVTATGAMERESRWRAERDFARSVTRSLGEGVVAVDTQGRITLMNPAAERLLGWAEDDALGRDLAALLSARDSDGEPLPLELSPGRQALRAGAEERNEDCFFVDRAGLPFPVRYEASPIEGGAITGAVVVFDNVSSLRLAERHQRTLAELGAALGTSRDSADLIGIVCRALVPRFADICVVDCVRDDGRIERSEVVFADPGKESLRDRVRAQVPRSDWETASARAIRLGKPVFVADATAVELMARDPEQLALVREADVTSVIAAPLLVRDRAIGALTCELTGSARRYRVADLALASDIARRAALALDNAHLYEEARAAIAARERVLAVVSHDLRNMIGAIAMGGAALLRATALEDWRERTRAFAERIQRSAERMTTLVERLLDFSRIQSGQLVLDLKDHDVAKVVGEAIATVDPIAHEKGIALRTAVDPHATRVRCDLDRMLQVLDNLLGNALKFTPRGGTITVGVEDMPRAVRLWVADTGPGIPEEQRSHIFDPFWQAKPSGRSGAGLGLAIAKGIVEAHGGTITVESELDVGTTFSAILPTEGATAPPRGYLH